MGIDLSVYRVRIGSFNARVMREKMEEKTTDTNKKTWIILQILLILLLIGNVELNPGPEKNSGNNTDDVDGKLCRLMELLKNISDEINVKLNRLQVEWNGVYKEIQELKKEMQNVKNQIQEHRRLERESRNHNIVIFGLKEYHNESKWDTCCRVMDLFASVLHVNLIDQQIDNLYWIGRRSHNRPLLIKFSSTLTKDFIMERANMFKGSKIRIDDVMTTKLE